MRPSFAPAPTYLGIRAASAFAMACATEQERRLAQQLASAEALDALPDLGAELDTDQEVVERVRHEMDEHLRVIRADGHEGDDEPAVRHDRQYTALRLAMLGHERATVVRLRDEGRIDDLVLRLVQTRLDIEEVRLSRREVVD